MGIVLAIIVFGTIVFVHEMGHFLLAKANGIRVDEFSLGMGPRLFSFVKGETRYSLKLLPLGGSCMMGEDDVDDVEEGSFNSKSVWARMSVIVAGAGFNFIFALIFAIILVGFTGYDEPVVNEVIPGYAAEASGMQAGDRIVRMDNKKINLWREISLHNYLNAGEEVDVVYERDGKKYEVTLEPKKDEDGNYLLGIQSSGQNTKANVLTAVQYGAYEVKFLVESTLESLKMLITGKAGVGQLSGPVGIVGAMESDYQVVKEYGFEYVILQFLNWGILLSANLGVMNLLPLPALDGGRLVFLILEAIFRRRVSPKYEGWVHAIGLILLLGLMAFVMFNDVRNLF